MYIYICIWFVDRQTLEFLTIYYTIYVCMFIQLQYLICSYTYAVPDFMTHTQNKFSYFMCYVALLGSVIHTVDYCIIVLVYLLYLLKNPIPTILRTYGYICTIRLYITYNSRFYAFSCYS